MLGLGFQRNLRCCSWKLMIFPSLISCFFVLISQFALTIVPRYFGFSHLLVKLSLSAVVLLLIAILGRICKGLLRIYASAPAFVFFIIIFIWGIHILVIRKVIPLLMDIVFNAECALLMIGLRSILYSDPGRDAYGDLGADRIVGSEVFEVIPHSEEEDLSTTDSCIEQPTVSESSFSTRRVRYCKICKAYIRGYDHHCPAFGNCIGEKNHVLFMVLLFGFIMVEASYVVCSNQFITKSSIMDKTMLETSLTVNLAISTNLFCLLQLLWQVMFLVWHIYCVCRNIKTDEWINWRKYPEFQLVEPQSGQSFSLTTFRNPYDKGVISNIKELLSSR